MFFARLVSAEEPESAGPQVVKHNSLRILLKIPTTSSENASQNLYDILPTATSIRVLELQQATAEKSSSLNCTLHVTDLQSECLEFSSLSYTWGDPLFWHWYENRSVTWDQDVPIIFNGVQVMITSNLEAALRAISRHTEGKTAATQMQYLWVDSLCIHQKHTQGRNAQVRLMAQIYSKAGLVISWLGPGDKDSEVAIPLIRRLLWVMKSSEFEHIHHNEGLIGFCKHSAKENLTIPDDDYGSLARFYARQYFFRCWVIQELILARKLCILCGSDELVFENLVTVAEFMTRVKRYRLREPIGQAIALSKKVNRGFELEAVWSKLHTGHRLMTEFQIAFTLGYLLMLTRTSSCFDPRDKVYAVLGMGPRSGFGIVPDYNKSTAEVYNEAIRYQIMEMRNLDVLSWVTDISRRRFPHFPS